MYALNQISRMGGTSRVNTQRAIRATTAAPTFFTPVLHEGGNYCDGALVANNPTAIALQEAKVLYPGVPVELVVSIGTGAYNGPVGGYWWDVLLSQIVATSVDTEEVHKLLYDFLSPDQYYRLNPVLPGEFHSTVF